MNWLPAWIARFLGIGHDLASRIDRVEWHWARPDLLGAGLALLVPVGFWIVRRHRERMPWLSRRSRRALDVCRIAMLALLVFVIAGPTLRLEERLEEKPVVAVVLDTSDSMRLPVGPLPKSAIAAVAGAAGIEPPPESDDAGTAALVERIGGLSRADLVRRVLESQAETTLRQLADGFELRRYEVARRPRRVRDAADARGPRAGNAAAKPAGPADREADAFDTSLGAAVEMAMDDASGRRLAGIVLFTDGRSTAGIDPLEAVRRAADASGGEPRAPVLAVPVGSPSPPVDVAVAAVLAAPVVALGDSVAIGVALESAGMAGRGVTAELRDAAGRVLESRKVTLKDGRQQTTFTWKADAIGSALLTVAVPAEADEATGENNAATVAVEVSDRRAKVLVVDHAARWDFRFIDHAIQRDTGFEAKMLLTGSLDPAAPGRGDAAGLPVDVDAWAAYDLVVLGDLPAGILDAARQRALVEAVATRGTGVVFQPGGRHLPREYAGAPLAELFPVEIDWKAGDGAATVEAAGFKPLAMRVTARGAMHPAFALGDDAARNRAQWSAMPSFFRAAAASGPKPSATVLAEVDAPGTRGAIPLVAEAPLGSGRVAWIGTDETFRWRRNVGDQLFWRFWGQALRSVARREDRPADAAWLAVSPGRCEPGSPVLVELNVPDDAARKAAAAAARSVSVERSGAGGAAATSLQLAPAGRPGLYAGTFTPDEPGRVVVRHAAAGAASLVAECVVAEPTRERARPGVDREALRALADVSGGAVVEIGDFSTIPYKLESSSVEAKLALEDEVWDTWPVLLLLVGLYCVDIAIRRFSGSS
jgi:hypothetical protein